MQDSQYVLGLDLGANSIGWALVDEANAKILASGVRVFPEGVDNFDTKKEKSKSEDRRVVRGMRRQIARRAHRKRRLREALVIANLYPADTAEQTHLDSLNPYALRRRGLVERLTPHEFGRVLLHLNQRRGFLSNRKSDRERKKETQGMLAEINELAGAIQATNCETVGQYFANSLKEDPHRQVRNHHTHRSMFEQEFDRLWEVQRQYHPDLLTDHRKHGELGLKTAVREPLPGREGKSPLELFGLWGLIFFQRPMYWPKSVVGQCELEPKRKRCARADRLAQRFRLLQEVNNLRYIEPESGDEQRLTKEQRTLLLAKLSERKEMTFDQIRKALGFLDSVAFNLEGGKRTKLQGIITDALLADDKLFGKAWHKRPDDEKTQIVRALVHGDEQEIRRLARDVWKVDEATTDRLLEVDLPPSYIRLSLTALEKLVPHMERGLLYMTGDGTPSALSEAGYLRPDQVQRKVCEELPEPPDVTNPVVRQALFELRKVVNSIIRKFGKPSAIRLELARNAAASSDERSKMSQRMREREAERDNAANKIREHGVKVTREAIDRYLLWQEQAEHCIYSGESIGIAQLFGGEVHIDHILPYSRCLDDSFANKVVCFLKSNRDKKNQTPYEWLAERDPEIFEKVRQRAYKLSYTKRRRFTQKELKLDDFIERQLNDTRYISRVALEYLRKLFAQPHHVLCPKGGNTETLRWLWGLNTVLREDSVNRKNRTDHRHHAIDAIVIALTDHKRLQALSQVNRFDAPAVQANRLAEPWETFRTDVEAVISAINVSHRVRRGVSGALHKDTRYGSTCNTGEYVSRKALEDLTPAMIEEIRDDVIRSIVRNRLESHGIRVGRGAKGSIPKEVWSKPLKMSSGVCIKRVRVVQRGDSYHSLSHRTSVELSNNHHMEIYELIGADGKPVLDKSGKTKREGILVPMLTAAKRIQNAQADLREVRAEIDLLGRSNDDRKSQLKIASSRIAKRHPVIERNAVKNAQFVMSLSINEMILLDMEDGRKVLHRVQKMSEGIIILRPHTYSGKVSDTDKPPLIQRRTPNTLRGRKVTITPLGEIRWAND